MRRLVMLLGCLAAWLLAMQPVHAQAADPVRLHDEVPAGAIGVRFALASPDSRKAAFVGDLTTPGALELYINDVGGAAATTLSQDFSGGGGVRYATGTVAFSPDSSRVFYLADPEVSGRWELYAASAAGGGAPKKISVAINHPGGEVESLLPLPDSTGVIYRVDPDQEGSYELFRAYYSGGDFAFQTRLSPQMPAGRTVSGYKLSPDGTRVIYRADQDSDDVYELYSAPAEGFDPDTGSWQGVKISLAVSGGGQIWNDFLITPDSATVIYLADHDGDGVNEFWRVGITGGTSLSLVTAASYGNGAQAGSLAVSPDGAWVMFLFCVDAVQPKLVVVNGSSWSVRTATPDMGSGTRVTDFKISPDGRWVAYRADKDTLGSWELWAQRSDGSSPEYKLNPPLAGLDDVQHYHIGANNRVVFAAKLDGESAVQLYGTSPAQDSCLNLNRGMAAGGQVSDGAGLARFGRLALYRADQVTDEALELWAVPASGLSAPARLSQALPPDHRVTNWKATGDEKRVIYIADYTSLHQYELYSTEMPAAGLDSGPVLDLLR